MARDEAVALGAFVRFLAGAPGGDAAAQAMVVGALAPLGFVAGQVYALAGSGRLELLGNFGYPDADAAAFRTVLASLPLPVSDAFTSGRTIAVPAAELDERYPLLEPTDADPRTPSEESLDTEVVCTPVSWAGSPIGALALLRDATRQPSPDDWSYVEAVAAAVALWLHPQRTALIEHWKRAAPLPHREFTISERQRKILFMIGEDRTNTEIARKLGYSVPTIKKDLQEIMKLLGTTDRRATAGRAREIGLLPDRRAGIAPTAEPRG
jgi:DNA-binding CsgD family transcriptional regulator